MVIKCGCVRIRVGEWYKKNMLHRTTRPNLALSCNTAAETLSPGNLFSLVRLVDRQGPGWWVSGVDPAGHPEVRKPLGLVWVVLLKGLSVIVGLLGGWSVVRECLGSILHLLIINLQKKKRRSIFYLHSHCQNVLIFYSTLISEISSQKYKTSSLPKVIMDTLLKLWCCSKR